MAIQQHIIFSCLLGIFLLQLARKLGSQNQGIYPAIFSPGSLEYFHNRLRASPDYKIKGFILRCMEENSQR
jgi:hypothetical protein